MLLPSLGNVVTIFQVSKDALNENDQDCRPDLFTGLWNDFVDHQLHIVSANLD